jgi:hypothetical protein
MTTKITYVYKPLGALVFTSKGIVTCYESSGKRFRVVCIAQWHSSFKPYSLFMTIQQQWKGGEGTRLHLGPDDGR